MCDFVLLNLSIIFWLLTAIQLDLVVPATMTIDEEQLKILIIIFLSMEHFLSSVTFEFALFSDPSFKKTKVLQLILQIRVK